MQFFDFVVEVIRSILGVMERIEFLASEHKES
jgi:hypothetical protein